MILYYILDIASLNLKLYRIISVKFFLNIKLWVAKLFHLKPIHLDNRYKYPISLVSTVNDQMSHESNNHLLLLWVKFFMDSFFFILGWPGYENWHPFWIGSLWSSWSSQMAIRCLVLRCDTREPHGVRRNSRVRYCHPVFL